MKKGNTMKFNIGSWITIGNVSIAEIMAENLANGNMAVALLGNTIATGAILFVIIKMFGSISGAHFNPAVSFMFFLRKELNWNDYLKFSFFQCTSGLIAVLLIHYIFEINIFQISTNIRGELPLLVSEILATSGLILTILFIRKNDPESIALGVALFITAGYWFTSSTSFANPAVTIARIFTNTFTGIAPISSLYFLSGQVIGCLLGFKIFNLFENNQKEKK